MVKKTNYVTKSNDLNEMMIEELRQETFTPVELKLFYTLVSTVRKEDDDFTQYQLSVDDFGDLINSSHHDVKKQIHVAGKRLMRKIVTFKKGKSTISTALLSSVETTDDKNHVLLRFDPNLRPELLRLGERFTSYTLQNIMAFKSAQSLRLYEILKQYEVAGEREIEIEEIKKMLMIKKSAYKRNADFKLYVIKKAVDEINDLTDIEVNFEQKKNNGKVSYRFEIRAKKVLENAKEKDKEVNLKPDERARLESFAEAVCSVTGCEVEVYLQEKIKQAQDNPKTISNPAAWIKTVMEADLKKAVKPSRPGVKKPSKKTGFHLPESRGKDYTNDELEKILLAKKKKSTIP